MVWGPRVLRPGSYRRLGKGGATGPEVTRRTQRGRESGHRQPASAPGARVPKPRSCHRRREEGFNSAAGDSGRARRGCRRAARSRLGRCDGEADEPASGPRPPLRKPGGARGVRGLPGWGGTRFAFVLVRGRGAEDSDSFSDAGGGAGGGTEAREWGCPWAEHQGAQPDKDLPGKGAPRLGGRWDRHHDQDRSRG